MSTLALGGSDTGTEAEGGARSRRSPLLFADLVALALALPLFWLMDWPLVGYAAVAAVWIVQRVAMVAAERRTAEALRAGERRTAVGLTAGSLLGRVWLVSASVLAVGLIADREDGLAAAVLAAVLFTIQFAATAIARMGESRGSG